MEVLVCLTVFLFFPHKKLLNKVSFSFSQGPKSKEDPAKNFLAMENLDQRIVARDSQ